MTAANEKPYPYWKIARVVGGIISMLFGIFLLVISIIEFFEGDFPFGILPVFMGCVGGIYIILGFLLGASGVVAGLKTGWVDRGVGS